MKKIGVTTFHRATNYGAVLQAYGLCEYLSSIGHKAELIDYCCEINDHSDLLDPKKYLSNPVNAIKKYYLRKRCLRFLDFQKKYQRVSNESYDRFNIDTFIDKYDLYITGSDQVWNPDIIGKENAFLLDFITDNSKKNSYAASIGLTKVSNETLQRYRDNLVHYKNISVREKEAAIILEQCGADSVKLVCDPSLLLEEEKWEALEKKVNTPEKYILVFTFGRDQNIWQKARELEKYTGIPVAMIGNRVRPYKDRIQFRGIGPQEWLYLIHHAEYVMTNSFHGMMFSIIFQKEFWVDDSKDGTYSRMIDLLERIGYSNRRLDLLEKINLSEHIDYNMVSKKLTPFVEDSKLFLKKVTDE